MSLIRTNLNTLVHWLISKLDKIAKALDTNDKATHPHSSYRLTSLSPTSEADKDEHYYKAIVKALERRKILDIKNMAITGPYGSGKSSIIKSILTKYTGRELKFINISLASFNQIESIRDGATTSDQEKKSILQQIEISILQQILYHSNPVELPESRIDRINEHKQWNSILLTIFASSYIFAILIVFFSEGIKKYLTFNEHEFINFIWINKVSKIFFCLQTIILIYQVIHFIKKLRITRINVQNIELGHRKKENTSIINHHIDELIYFFQRTKYNVLIIEDLDRFEMRDIFVKLRETNLILNNSNLITDRVVFVYALRDDLFQDTDRTKFFDIIVPVVPIIDYTNVNQMLTKNLENISSQIEKTLITDISLFIQDMRVLKNIINEFYMYKAILGKELNLNNLLAIITYKNAYPTDYSLLIKREGILFKALSEKETYAIQINKETAATVNQNNKTITELEKESITDIQILKILYISKSNINFTEFNRLIGMSRFDIDFIFSKITSNSLPSNYFINSNPVKFEEIDREMEVKYDERKITIENKNKIDITRLKAKTEELQIEMTNNNNMPLAYLFSKVRPVLVTDHKHNQLLYVLISNGYIDENFEDYISLFHEGELTKLDYDFLLNVKGQRTSPYSTSLINIENIVAKITVQSFSHYSIYNFDIVDHFLYNGHVFNEKSNLLFKQLGNETVESIKFTDAYFERGQNLPDFFEALCSNWVGIWDYLGKSMPYSEEKHQSYFFNIINYADLESLIAIADASNLRQVSENTKDLLSLIQDPERSKKILKGLNLKLRFINDDYTNLDVINFIYVHNHYQINDQFLQKLLKTFSKNFNEQEYFRANYSYILKLNIPSIIDRISREPNEYVKQIYNHEGKKGLDKPSDIVKLLNNENLLLENKLLVVSKFQSKIEALKEVDHVDVAKMLLHANKAKPTWGSIFNYMHKNGSNVSNEIVAFMQTSTNFDELVKLDLALADLSPDFSAEQILIFISILLSSNELTYNEYRQLLTKFENLKLNIEWHNLAREKVEVLIAAKMLAPTSINYEKIKYNFSGLQIELIWSHQSIEFEDIVEDYDFEIDDCNGILAHPAINNEVKQSILDFMAPKVDEFSLSTLEEITKVVNNDPTLLTTTKIANLIIINERIKIDERIVFLNINKVGFDTESINTLIMQIGKKYEKLINASKPTIPIDAFNKNLLEGLKTQSYIVSFTPDPTGSKFIVIK